MIERKLELWGGVECTVNRVGGDYFEQLGRSGHSTRITDLDLFAKLGITSIRQPVIWEQITPSGDLRATDWRWPDRWLSRLRELSLKPIAGLVHHGSGPRNTHLLDPEFPNKLSEYARAVAERYPWVSDYTPVNEPLTTARFSGLYGFWYPHKRDDRGFVTALLNECRGVVLAMRAIRELNPKARLIQTDDLGKVFSTPLLKYQADFENERRWLAFDLLCGRIRRDHPLWKYLLKSGATERALEWFNENRCPPDIIGVNHYLSSERFLDEHLNRYPAQTHGGNGTHRYADVLAARVRAKGPAGPKKLLSEVWDRYRLPIAITEVHNGCTREEQLRWVLDVWNAALNLQQGGVDVRAVTAWSLLGAFDWNSLVTVKNDHYEPGVFDIRGGQPRPTALAHLFAELASGREPQHPVLDTPGWWERPQRLIYGFALTDSGTLLKAQGPQVLISKADRHPRPLLITGGRGTLGRALARACVLRGIPHRLLLRSEMDIADPESVHTTFHSLRPWAVINAAGYVRVDDAETDRKRCYRENTDGPSLLAKECKQIQSRFVTFSSDLVFDGSKTNWYVESDQASPLNHYGRSKALAEVRVLDSLADALVVRTSAFFGPWDEYNFVTIALRTIRAGNVFRAAADSTVSPTYVPDLVNATLDLLIDGENGVWHVANHGAATWAELAINAAQRANLNSSLVEPCLMSDFGLPAPRPLFTPLSSERACVMPSLEDALARYIEDCEALRTQPASRAS